MKVFVINGSPKGDKSITLQSVRYLEKRFSDDVFSVVNVGSGIKKFFNKDILENTLKQVAEAELVLFSYPVYTLLAPYQLHKFLELIEDYGLGFYLKEKLVAQITTSMHFYDNTAEKCIKETLLDFGCRYVGCLPAAMQDLLNDKGRADLKAFWEFVRFSVGANIGESAVPYVRSDYVYRTSAVNSNKKSGFDTVLITDCREEDTSLKNMIDDFIALYPYPVRVENLNDFSFKGGCLGCLNCTTYGKCVYKDGFENYLRDKLNSADAFIYAGKISQHSFRSVFKEFFDRQFVNGHRTVSAGKPCAYIVSGNLREEGNFCFVAEARLEVGSNFNAGIVSDTAQNDMLVYADLKNTAQKLAYALENGYKVPQNFLGVGGMLIFRDMVWKMRGLMAADHKFYKKHGVYNFPQKEIGTLVGVKMLGGALKIKKIRAKIMPELPKYMLLPYEKVVNNSKT